MCVFEQGTTGKPEVKAPDKGREEPRERDGDQCSCLENPHGPRSLEGYSLQGRKGRTRLKWLSTLRPTGRVVLSGTFLPAACSHHSTPSLSGQWLPPPVGSREKEGPQLTAMNTVLFPPGRRWSQGTRLDVGGTLGR